MLRFTKKNNHHKIRLAAFLFVVTVLLTFPYVTHAAWYDLASNAVNEITAQIVNLSLHLNSLILGLAGMLFDVVIKYTIIDMSKNLPTAINVAWGTFRDLANMFFIFILLY